MILNLNIRIFYIWDISFELCHVKMFKFLNIITFTIIILCTIILCEESDSYFGNKNEDLDKCEGDDCQKSEEINTNLKNYSNEVNLIITFTNAIGNNNLIRKFRLTVTSLFEHTSVPLAIHIIGEPESQKLASDIIEDVTKNKKPYRVSKYYFKELRVQAWVKICIIF